MNAITTTKTKTKKEMEMRTNIGENGADADEWNLKEEEDEYGTDDEP